MTQKLIAPEGMTSITFQEESFEVVDGMVEVPAEAVAELASHGFKPWFPKRKGGSKKDSKALDQINDQGGDQGGDQNGEENQGGDDQSGEGDQGGDQNGEQ